MVSRLFFFYPTFVLPWNTGDYGQLLMSEVAASVLSPPGLPRGLTGVLDIFMRVAVCLAPRTRAIMVTNSNWKGKTAAS